MRYRTEKIRSLLQYERSSVRQYCSDGYITTRLGIRNSMSRGVTDLNVNFLGNWGFSPMVSHHVFRQIGVCTTHGAFTPSHIPPLRAALPFQISDQDFFASRPVSLPGPRATDFPRKPARHRNLSACSPSQALSLGHQRQYRQEHTGRCQRAARLPHLRGFRDEPNPDCQVRFVACTQQLKQGIESGHAGRHLPEERMPNLLSKRHWRYPK